MNIRPTGKPQGNLPSKGKPEETKSDNGKNFQLPSRKDSVDEKEEQPQKKKGLFDLVGQDAAVQAKMDGLEQQMQTASAKAESIAATEGKAQIEQISQIIQGLVESMRIGQIDGKNFASLDLKTTSAIPEAFAGANLTVSYAENGLAIHFDRFMTVQQQNAAINLVEQNKEQLAQMIQALNAKNIQVTELTLGTHTVSLPRVAPLPPPFQSPSSAQADTRQQQDKGQQEGGEQGQGQRQRK